MEEKRRGRISFVGLPVQPTRSMPRKAARDLVREKLTLLAAACDGSSNQPPVCCMSRRSRRLLLNCFDTDIIAEDGREFEYVFETDEQTAPKTVGEEKATEIAMDWMRVFYHVQVGTMKARNLEQGQYHIGFSVFQRRLKDKFNECILSSSYPTGWLLNRNLRSGYSCVCSDPI